MANVRLTDDARADLQGLDRSAQAMVVKRLQMIRADPTVGKPLTRGLRGCRSLRVGNRDWRIVYIDNDDEVLVVAIGRRDGAVAYREAERRVKQMPRPLKRAMRELLDNLDDIESLFSSGKPRRRRRRQT